MRNSSIILTCAILSLLPACARTSHIETNEEIRISFGAGGHLATKVEEYNAYRKSGKRIVVDGHVISADAYLAFSTLNSCYTENAIVSLHAVSHLGVIPDKDLTEQMTQLMPYPLAQWFRSSWASKSPLGYDSIDYRDLKEIWPEGECSRT